jgi:hypothetical protein
MTEDTFWEIIAKAQSVAGKKETYADQHGMDCLQRELERLSPDEIVSFDLIFSQKLHDAYRWDLWAAAFIILGGCSDDGFLDFRSELVARGRSTYEAALKDPQSLADADPDMDGAEGWQYLAGNAYKAKTCQDLPISADRPRHPKEPAGEDWDEATVGAKFPRLAEKYGF